jgi:hypothetical protein
MPTGPLCYHPDGTVFLMMRDIAVPPTVTHVCFVCGAERQEVGRPSIHTSRGFRLADDSYYGNVRRHCTDFLQTCVLASQTVTVELFCIKYLELGPEVRALIQRTILEVEASRRKWWRALCCPTGNCHIVN